MTDPTAPPYEEPAEEPAAPDKSGNIFGLLSLIGGIASIVLCCLFAGFWAGIPAIILGVIGIRRANEGRATNKRLAIVGVVLGAIGLLYVVVDLIVYGTGHGMKVGGQNVG